MHDELDHDLVLCAVLQLADVGEGGTKRENAAHIPPLSSITAVKKTRILSSKL